MVEYVPLCFVRGGMIGEVLRDDVYLFDVCLTMVYLSSVRCVSGV